MSRFYLMLADKNVLKTKKQVVTAIESMKDWKVDGIRFLYEDGCFYSKEKEPMAVYDVEGIVETRLWPKHCRVFIFAIENINKQTRVTLTRYRPDAFHMSREFR